MGQRDGQDGPGRGGAGAKDVLPRAEAWLRENAPAITARLTQPG